MADWKLFPCYYYEERDSNNMVAHRNVQNKSETNYAISAQRKGGNVDKPTLW